MDGGLCVSKVDDLLFKVPESVHSDVMLVGEFTVTEVQLGE